MAKVFARMQQKRDLEAVWTANDPVLLAGEIGYESDTGKFKVGDGTTIWSLLAYAGGGGGGGASATYIAAESITALDVLAIDGSGDAQIADIATATKRDVIGIALDSVLISEEVEAQKLGHVEGFTGLTIGETYFLSTAGTIDIASNIGAGYPLIRVGYAVATTILDVSIEPGIEFNIADIPLGQIFAFGGVAAPVGSLLCDGAQVSRSIYSELFTAIGTTWGIGDGSTTFNLPDLRGAFLRGEGAHGSEVMADGNPYEGPAVGGFEDDQLQGHNHEGAALIWGATSGGSNISTMDAETTDTGVDNANALTDDGVNGPPRSGDETRGFAGGILWCIKAEQILTMPDPVTVGSLRYDTGWVPNTDWTNVGLVVNHNLTSPISELIIKVFVKNDSDGLEREIFNVVYNRSDTSLVRYGYSLVQDSEEAFTIWTGADGILYQNTSGSLSGLGAGAYRVICYKPEIIEPTFDIVGGSFKYDTGWLDYSGTNELYDLTLNVPHNLDAPLSELVVQAFYSTDGSEENSEQTINATWYQSSLVGAPDRYYGSTWFAVDDNNLRYQTGAWGIMEVQEGSGIVNARVSGYIKIAVYKPEIVANLLPQEFEGVKYDSGWVAMTSGWLNKILTVTHNLDAPMPDLILRFFLSENGTDAGSFEITTDNVNIGSTDWQTGLTWRQNSLNQIEGQTGAQGLGSIMASGGIRSVIDTETTWSYKLVVYKPQVVERVTTPALKHDTGWIDSADFTAAEILITHGLNAPLEDLITHVEFGFAGGTDVRHIASASVGSGDYGYELRPNDNNSFYITTASTGILVIDEGGTYNYTAHSSGSYRVICYKPEVTEQFFPTTLGSVKFTSGWIANSDWTDMTLDVVHGLGEDVSDLIIRFFVSSTGNPNTGIEVFNTQGGTPNYGYQFSGIDNDTIRFQTGANGILYFNSAGSGIALDSESWFYKFAIYKPEVIATTIASPLNVFDISAGNESFELPADWNLYEDLVVKWSGGDGTYKLSIDPSAGFTIEGDAAGVWEGQGAGSMTVIRTSASEWLVKEYRDTSAGVDFGGGTYSDGYFKKEASGEMRMWGEAEHSGLAISTAMLGGFRSSGLTIDYPLAFAASPEIILVSGSNTLTFGMGGQRNGATPTTNAILVFQAVSSQGGAQRIARWEVIGHWK